MSTLRRALMPVVSAALTSPTLARWRETVHETRRRLTGAPHRIEWFYQADDPYSHLLAQVLPRIVASYAVTVRLHLVPPPDRAAAPEPELLVRYALRDAVFLAQALGIDFPADATPPDPGAVKHATARLAALPAIDPDLDTVATVGSALWHGAEAASASSAAVDEAALHDRIAADDRARRKLGHYLGGTLYYGGVWYWGTDRLGHLLARLDRLGVRTAGAPDVDVTPQRTVSLPDVAPPLEVFFSFRSPYSAIAMPRVFDLARRYGVELALRPVLPMVMRGLPLPTSKQRYIMLDAKREADRLGVPFGRIADPVGSGAERCLAVLHHVFDTDRAEAFVRSAMRGIWAEGLDAASDAGLGTMAERAGITTRDIAAALADPSWRARVEDNRVALFAAGLWGVPSFRLGQLATWGQDRLWLVEQALQAVRS
jgi:2-hydroxychromene-2-carboxylate isomerase